MRETLLTLQSESNTFHIMWSVSDTLHLIYLELGSNREKPGIFRADYVIAPQTVYGEIEECAKDTSGVVVCYRSI